LPLKR